MLKIFHGARATESGVLADLDSLLEYGADDLAVQGGGSGISLAEPVRVVVPSRSLRDHLARRYLQHRGRPVLGLTFQTLQGLALEILQRAGEGLPRGKVLFPLLVERFAREEPELRRQLDDLVEGYQPVVGTVRDLVDAGLEEGLLGAALEALMSGPGQVSQAARSRAEALVRVADGVVRAMVVMEAGRPSDALIRARRLLEEDPEAALPARAVLVHGFADATGKVMGLLEGLVQYRGAHIYLDHPPMPHAIAGTAEGAEVEARFPARLRERLESAGARAVEGEPSPSQAFGEQTFTLLEAADPEAEVRAAAGWIRRHLADGAAPEDLALVARDLSAYETEIWRCFRRLGIPFTFWGDQGSATEAGRVAEGVLDLLRQGERSPVDRWLQVVSGFAPSQQGREDVSPELPSRKVELRLALHSLGVGRLEEILTLDLESIRSKGGVTLPNLQVSEEDPAGDQEPSGRPRRRKLPAVALEEAVASARNLLEILEGWPESAPLAEHLQRFDGFVRNGLGWTGEAPEQGLLQDLQKASGQILDFSALEIDRNELHRLLAGMLEGAGRRCLGGKGGGVQILSVTEARGRTFAHLLVLGMNRGQMPRIVREDPLLPDALRFRLLPVLPDIPLKQRGFDEERYLFAQLVSAAGTVTMARPASDHDGRPVPPSPLLARLQAEASAKLVLCAAEEVRPRPADEHAIAAGLAGNRSLALEALRVVTAEAHRQEKADRQENDESAVDASAWSRALGAVLAELDPDLRTPEGWSRSSRLGPFLGLVGPIPESGRGVDPRASGVWVTHLEGIAACPWQTFLRRLLRLEPSPDPLQALPDLSPLLLGRVVHGTVERIVGKRPGKNRLSLEDLQGKDPQPIPWPEPMAFEAMLSQEVEQTLAQEGIGLALLAEPLKEQARGLLAQVRELLWDPHGGRLETFGAEIVGKVAIGRGTGADNEARPVAFRADLVLPAAGGMRLVDLKTGRSPISSAKGDATRRKHLLQDIRRGGKLQGAAYALAPGSAEGEYLFVHPDLRGEYRSFAVEDGDDEARAAFAAAADTTLDAWETGTLFPRLVDPQGQKEPDRCKSCEVAEACLRGDSGVRRRLLEVSETLAKKASGGESLGDEKRVFLELWHLPDAQLGEERST